MLVSDTFLFDSISLDVLFNVADHRAVNYNGTDMMAAHKHKFIRSQAEHPKVDKNDDKRALLAKFALSYNRFSLSSTCLDNVSRTCRNIRVYSMLKHVIATGTSNTTGAAGPSFGAAGPSFGAAPVMQPQASGGTAPNVVYVPRNVYVPVIKPVFVPRERK
jgi:hypothetical protein